MSRSARWRRRSSSRRWPAALFIAVAWARAEPTRAPGQVPAAVRARGGGRAGRRQHRHRARLQLADDVGVLDPGQGAPGDHALDRRRLDRRGSCCAMPGWRSAIARSRRLFGVRHAGDHRQSSGAAAVAGARSPRWRAISASCCWSRPPAGRPRGPGTSPGGWSCWPPARAISARWPSPPGLAVGGLPDQAERDPHPAGAELPGRARGLRSAGAGRLAVAPWRNPPPGGRRARSAGGSVACGPAAGVRRRSPGAPAPGFDPRVTSSLQAARPRDRHALHRPRDAQPPRLAGDRHPEPRLRRCCV